MTTIAASSERVQRAGSSGDHVVAAEAGDANPPDAVELLQRRRRRGLHVLALVVPPLVALAIALSVWSFISYRVLAPRRRFLLPPPDVVLREAFLDAQVMGRITSALIRTAEVALLGYVIAIVIGITVAVVMSQALVLERAIHPWAVVLDTVPVIVMVPLIGFWFKYGLQSRVLVCVLIAAFPIIINTLFGLKSVDPSHDDLFRLHGAGRWRRLWSLLLPGALPAIFVGLRIAASGAVIGSIGGDIFFQQGRAGIGRTISVYTEVLAGPPLFAAIIVSALLGLSLFAAVGLLSRLVIGRWHASVRQRRHE